MGKAYRFHSVEEKLRLVERYLAGESSEKLGLETGISGGNIRKWRQQYLSGGKAALENKKKPGNPLSRYANKKELSRAEQLEYEIELLKRELLKQESEAARLKKCIELERDDTKRK